MSGLWCFNGIDAVSGSYLLQASPADIVKVATGAGLDPRVLGELKYRHKHTTESHFGVKAGIDVKDLSETGWGVVFPAAKPDSPAAKRQAAIREALAPLLAHRCSVAGRAVERYYKEYSGVAGVRPGEGKQQFLARHGAGPGPADPEKVPYYLLLVGDPQEIPFRFQSQIGVQYAVGRICFDTIEEYAHYARSVVAAETQALALDRRLSFFSVANPDDDATQSSASALVAPLADLLAKIPQLAGWSIEQIAREAATHEAFAGLLGRSAPALLFTASHGMGFPKDHPLQLRHQGALLCQDWPGPKAWGRKPIPEEHYFAGDHLPADADLLGTVAFLFACYGAGTPELDEFAAQAFKGREAIAPHPFVSALPKAMLSRPKGGALAVIGHVERAWGHSFLWAGTGGKGKPGAQLAVFESAMRSLMEGMPVGAAMEYFDERYAELASDLSVELERAKFGEDVDEYELAGMWTANNDARGYAILGDPAVRVMTTPGPIKDRAAIDRRVEAVSYTAPTPGAEARPSVPVVSAPIASFAVGSQAPPGQPGAAPPPVVRAEVQPSTPIVPVPPPVVRAEVQPSTPIASVQPGPGPSVPDVSSRDVLAALRGLGAGAVLVTSRGTNGAEIKTRIVEGSLETTFIGAAEPSAAQLEHHEALVRAACKRQLRALSVLLRGDGETA
jgi:hypothetical protein